jgi:hypothetical protein
MPPWWRPGEVPHLPLPHGQDLVAENDGVQAVGDGEGGAVLEHAPDGALDQDVRLWGQGWREPGVQGVCACVSWKVE